MPLVDRVPRPTLTDPLKKSTKLIVPSASVAFAVSRMSVPGAKTAPLVGRIQVRTGNELLVLPPLTEICAASDTLRVPALSTASARNWYIPAAAFVQTPL